MKQITREEAIALHDSGAWKDWTHMERASFQLVQNCLSMPFGVFHESLTVALGRPVFTHELGLNRDGLIRELAGVDAHPTVEQIVGLIPSEKLLIVSV